MPFDRGPFSMTIFRLPKVLPENALELFDSYKAGKLDDIKKDEQQIGWVSGRHLLERTIDDETALLGGHIYLNLRTAQRKIPATLLKAEIRMEELVYIKATNNPDVSRKVKKEIKEAIIEKRINQMVPTISGIQFVIDKTDNTLYLGAISGKQIDIFLQLFHKTLNIEPIQITPEEIMLEKKMKTSNYNGIPAADNATSESHPGRDFLTWLWFFSEEKGGIIDVPKYGQFSVMIDGPLSFIAEGNGALESVVRKGNPLKSAEARAALEVGKKLKRAKIILARAKEMWLVGFDADNFSFSGVSLPQGEEMDYASRFAERVNSLHIFKTIFYALFASFLNEAESESWKNTLSKMKKWIETRESL